MATKRNLPLLVLFVTLISVGCKKKQPAPTIEPLQIDTSSFVQDTIDSTFVNEENGEFQEIEDVPVEMVSEEGVNLSDNFFLIAASFSLPENARKKVNEFREYGYKAKVIMRGNDSKYRIALRSYSSKAEALTACENLKDNDPDLNTMWVLVSSTTEDREFDNY